MLKKLLVKLFGIKLYNYSFTYIGANNLTGRIELDRPTKITTHEQLEKLDNIFSDKNNVKCIIMNFTLLRTYKVSKQDFNKLKKWV